MIPNSLYSDAGGNKAITSSSKHWLEELCCSPLFPTLRVTAGYQGWEGKDQGSPELSMVQAQQWSQSDIPDTGPTQGPAPDFLSPPTLAIQQQLGKLLGKEEYNSEPLSHTLPVATGSSH